MTEMFVYCDPCGWCERCDEEHPELEECINGCHPCGYCDGDHHAEKGGYMVTVDD